MTSFQDAPTNIFRMSKETRFVLVNAFKQGIWDKIDEYYHFLYHSGF